MVDLKNPTAIGLALLPKRSQANISVDAEFAAKLFEVDEPGGGRGIGAPDLSRGEHPARHEPEGEPERTGKPHGCQQAAEVGGGSRAAGRSEAYSERRGRGHRRPTAGSDTVFKGPRVTLSTRAASTVDSCCIPGGTATGIRGTIGVTSGAARTAIIAACQTRCRVAADARVSRRDTSHATARITVDRTDNCSISGSLVSLSRCLRQTIELRVRQLALVDQRRCGLGRRAIEERLDDVSKRRSASPVPRHGRQEHVAGPILLVAEVALLLEDPQERAHRRVAWRIGSAAVTSAAVAWPRA